MQDISIDEPHFQYDTSNIFEQKDISAIFTKDMRAEFSRKSKKDLQALLKPAALE